MADLPHPSETAEADLIVKFVFFEFVALFKYHLTVAMAELHGALSIADEHGVPFRQVRTHLNFFIGRSFHF